MGGTENFLLHRRKMVTFKNQLTLKVSCEKGVKHVLMAKIPVLSSARDPVRSGTAGMSFSVIENCIWEPS